ncbi:MAG: Mov34/MPN/PAD-1 family protein [Promethearchaeota archaeon]
MKYERKIKIILNREIFEALIVCVKKAYPNEACGLIFGDIKKFDLIEGYEIHFIGKKFNCLQSDKKSPVAFLIDNIERFNEVFQEAAQKFNLRLISIFHSHPGGAYPSGIDKKNMVFLNNCGIKAFKNQIWTIIDARSFELNGFIFFNNELKQIDVKIED